MCEIARTKRVDHPRIESCEAILGASRLARRLLGWPMVSPRQPKERAPGAGGAVIVVDDAAERWRSEVASFLRAQGFRVARIKELDMVPFLLLSGGITALLLDARKLTARDAMILARCRKLAPAMSTIFVTSRSSQLDLKYALENGATAVISWPESRMTVLGLLRSEPGDVPA